MRRLAKRYADRLPYASVFCGRIVFTGMLVGLCLAAARERFQRSRRIHIHIFETTSVFALPLLAAPVERASAGSGAQCRDRRPLQYPDPQRSHSGLLLPLHDRNSDGARTTRLHMH